MAKIREILEGDDLNARLALLADLKEAGRDAIPTETQDYLIDRAIRDFEERMEHGMLVDRFTDYARLFNRKFDAKEKMRSEIMLEQMDLALTFHRPTFLPRLVLVRPGWQILQSYGAEGLQAMLDQGEAIMAGRRYGQMADAMVKLVEAGDSLPWRPSKEQWDGFRTLFQTKLNALENTSDPCLYPDRPEPLIEALLTLEATGIRDQGARVLRKCLPHETVVGTLSDVRFMAKHRLPGTEEVLNALIAAEPAGPIRDHYQAVLGALQKGAGLPEYSAAFWSTVRERDDHARKSRTNSLRTAQMQQLKILGAMAAVGTVITLALAIGWWRWIKRNKTV